MIVNSIFLRESEKLKAPRHASAAATRDGNMPYMVTTCLYSQQLQTVLALKLQFYLLYRIKDICYISAQYLSYNAILLSL